MITTKLNINAVPDELISRIDALESSNNGSNGSNDLNNMTNITYSELKSLRDNSQLVPGAKYRITDYKTTTTQSNTKAVNNQFDIIVTADSSNTLNHIAHATKHDGVTYFDNCDLEAWQLWYDIDNDTNKYEWADGTNGKGVIYRMIDDKNNDCPYDFKNIILYTNKFTSDTTSDKYYYTFSYVVNNVLYDGTVESQVKTCYGNSMKIFLSASIGKQSININIFRNNDFTDSCHSNTFGYNCYKNTFGYGCRANTFGNECYSNAFGDGCILNIFGNKCYSNTFGHNCRSNTFIIDCRSNTFGKGCEYNTFINDCYSNTFGTYCKLNTFGSGCYSNTFGNYCNSNTFGNECYSNTFGNYCNSNTFGDNCYSNILGNSKTSPKSYYKYIIFDNGNCYINLYCTSTTSSSKYYQNVRIGLGVNNTSTTKTISDSNVGQAYETHYKPTNSQTTLV